MVCAGQRGQSERAETRLSEIDGVERRAEVTREIVGQRIGDAVAIELHADKEQPQGALSASRGFATHMQSGRTRRSKCRRTRRASLSSNARSASWPQGETEASIERRSQTGPSTGSPSSAPPIGGRRHVNAAPARPDDDPEARSGRHANSCDSGRAQYAERAEMRGYTRQSR